MDHKMMSKEKMLNQIKKQHKWMAEKMGVKLARMIWMPKDSTFSA